MTRRSSAPVLGPSFTMCNDCGEKMTALVGESPNGQMLDIGPEQMEEVQKFIFACPVCSVRASGQEFPELACVFCNRPRGDELPSGWLAGIETQQDLCRFHFVICVECTPDLDAFLRARRAQ